MADENWPKANEQSEHGSYIRGSVRDRDTVKFRIRLGVKDRVRVRFSVRDRARGRVSMILVGSILSSSLRRRILSQGI